MQAIGTDSAWLASHASVGARLSVPERLRTPDGRPLALQPGTTVTSAGPMLRQNGRTDIDAAAEGVFDPRDTTRNTSDGHRRHCVTFGSYEALKGTQ